MHEDPDWEIRKRGTWQGIEGEYDRKTLVVDQDLEPEEKCANRKWKVAGVQHRVKYEVVVAGYCPSVQHGVRKVAPWMSGAFCRGMHYLANAVNVPLPCEGPEVGHRAGLRDVPPRIHLMSKDRIHYY